MKIKVICVAYRRAVSLRILIDSFITQTNPNWELYVVHDGETPQDVKNVMSQYDDLRIGFAETEKRPGTWGHENRRWMLQNIAGDNNDYVLITNDDNYYVPTFVECFLGACSSDVGFIYCNTLHSYLGYEVLFSKVKECFIDMGSFIVRLDMAKKTGFNHMHEQADGRYAEECAITVIANRLRVVHLNKTYFVHN